MGTANLELLGSQKDRALLFPKESRGNPFKGFLWAISSRRLDTALLSAAKKRGVESTGWQVSARITLALAATDDKTNYIAAFIKANTSRKR